MKIPAGFIQPKRDTRYWCSPSQYIFVDVSTTDSDEVWMFYNLKWHLFNQKEYDELLNFLEIL